MELEKVKYLYYANLQDLLSLKHAVWRSFHIDLEEAALYLSEALLKLALFVLDYNVPVSVEWRDNHTGEWTMNTPKIVKI